MLSIDDLDAELQQIIDECAANDEAARVLKEKYDGARDSISVKRIDYCISKFLDGEFDYKSSGMRGIGRTTDDLPRFGAYYRNEISRVSSDEIDQLRALARKIMLRGYLTHILNYPQDKATIESPESGELYEKWIPRIYVTGFEEFPQSVQNVLSNVGDEPYNKFIEMLERLGIRKKSGFFKKDLTPPILIYYLIAGFGLRIVEAPP